MANLSQKGQKMQKKRNTKKPEKIFLKLNSIAAEFNFFYNVREIATRHPWQFRKNVLRHDQKRRGTQKYSQVFFPVSTYIIAHSFEIVKGKPPSAVANFRLGI